MGGSKAKKAKPVHKERPKVPTIFDCPFCNHSATVECKMDRTSGTGTITCRVCAAKFQARITHLDDPIDLFSKWVDQSEDLNK